MSLPWSSKGSKGTPIAADELLIIDSADANPSTQNKRITIGTLPTTEITTWTADHDAAGFDLLNAGGITINNPADSFQYIVTPGAITADRILNLPVIDNTDTLIVQSLVQTISNKTLNNTNEFEDDGLVIQNPANTFNYLFQSAAIVADRTLTLPLLTGNDIIVTEAHTSTFTNKTFDLTDNTLTGTTSEFNTALSDNDFATLAGIESLTNKTFDNTNEFVDDGLIIQNPANTFNNIFQSSAILADRTITIPLLTASDTFAFIGHAQSWTAKQTFQDDSIEISNPADTFQFILQSSAILADRTLTIPLLTGNDTLVTEAHIQTLTNKTITAAGNTLTIASTDLTDTAVIVRTDQTNTFGDFAQIIPDNQLFIQNPAATFEYQIIAAAIAADRTLTFPLLTGNDTFVTEAFTQTLTNKTLTTPTIASFVNATHDHTNAAGGNTLVATTALTATGTKDSTTFLRGDDTWVVPPGGGDMVLASIQTVTGAKTFEDGTMLLRNVADTFDGSFVNTNTADRIYTLPDVAGTVSLIANTETLTNKTLGTGTVFSVIPTINDGITFTFNPNATVSGVNVGGHTTNPSVPVNGDVWYNSTSGQIFGRANGTNVDLGAAGAGAPPFADSTSIVEGSIDPTKEIRFEVDGLTTATTRVITPPDADITLVNTSDGLITNTNVDAAAAIVTSKLADSANFVLINQANTFGDFAQTFADNQLFIQNPAATFEFQISAPGIAADRTLTLPLLTGNDTFVTEAFAQTLTNKTITAAGNTLTIASTDLTDTAVIVRTDQTNTFGDFAQIIPDNQLFIQNPATTFEYQIIAAAIAADRTVTLPLLTGNDTFATEAFAQTLTNKTMTAGANTFSGFAIGTEVTGASTDLTDTAVIVRTDQTNTFGDFAQIIPDNQLFIQNPAATFEYQIIAAAIVADRTATLPLLTGNDTFVMEAHTSTLTNKTFDLTDNTLTGTTAEFNTALSDGSFATLAGTESLTNKTFDNTNEFVDDGLIIQNPADTFNYIFQSAAIVADRTITLPLLTGNDTMAVIGFANAWGTVDQNIAATGKWQEGGVDISPIGLHDAWIPASAMWPSTTSGATGLTQRELATNDVDIQTWDYTSTTVDEYTQFTWTIPQEWNAGTITVEFFWTATGGAAGNVVWGIQATAFDNDNPLDTAWGTIQEVTDAWIANDDLHISAATSAVTIAGTPVAGEMVQFRVIRSGSDASDTFATTAGLLGIRINYTTDSATV